MEDIAIKVESVSKTFKLPHEKNTSIKSATVNFYKRRKGYELQKALDNISFEVKKGEFFGIVGRNGSGKSTLLKLLASIYAPSQGQVHIRGSLTPFIELGVGFNPELTGRENVFLNGALLGFGRKEMSAMYNDIVEFAELEKFMDQKLKNYSSGMQVRLAFSIAIRAESDILLIDEVLAVGDEAFQQKCLDIFEDYKSKQKTIILVTHDMSTVERFCSRAMLINNGHLVEIGDPRKVAKMYRDINEKSTEEYLIKENIKREKQTSVKITGKKGKQLSYTYGEDAVIEVDWSKNGEDINGVGVAIVKQNGEYIFGSNTFLDNYKINNIRSIKQRIKLNIGSGKFVVKVGLFGDDDSKVIDFVEGPTFIMKSRRDDIKWGGLIKLPHSWE